MTDFRSWFHTETGRRITAEEIGNILELSRASATRRLVNDSFTADEIISLTRSLQLNPLLALTDLGRITEQEIWGYLESDGQLVETAEDGTLALELARRLNPDKEITGRSRDELSARRRKKSARRSNRNTPGVADGVYTDGTVEGWDDTLPHAADSSPDEDQLREEEGASDIP